MNTRFSLTSEEQDILRAVMDYTMKNIDTRLGRSCDDTDLLALRISRRDIGRLRGRMFPAPRVDKA